MFKVNEIVRIADEPKGSPNAYGMVLQIGDEWGRPGLYWVSNINMPFYGTKCGWMAAGRLEKE